MNNMKNFVKLTYRDAVRAAIREAMHKDERVFLMGEDVGHYGGCLAVSKGLLAEFGPDQIRDTPLSESSFVGAGIGAALRGHAANCGDHDGQLQPPGDRPNSEYCRKLSPYVRRLFNVPIVIRMSTGGGKQLAAQHSHSFEGWYAHIPGIKVLPRQLSKTLVACSGLR